MIDDLLAFFSSIQADRTTRAVVIGANGKTFCAGGDLKDMQKAAMLEPAEQQARLKRFDEMLQTINQAPQVTIARIQGAALGGGFGLACVSDIAIAAESASFGLPEVRIGMVPALISPYVIARIGLTRTRQLALTGERFGAAAALAYGLVHEVCPDDALDLRVDAILEAVLQGAPDAIAATKALLFHVAASPEDTVAYRSDLLQQRRESAEGQEGVRAFIEKRKPAWAIQK